MTKTSETIPNSGAKTRVVFFGNERIATAASTTAPILRILIADGYDVALIVANDNETISRKSRMLEVESIADEYNIPFSKPEKLSDIQDMVADLHADIGVLVAYGKIIPQSIIDIFPHGIVNIHPSLLPKHRGSTPIESTILNGELETGVALMQIAKEMDAGPIFAIRHVGLTSSETKQSLADSLDTLGAELLHDTLPGIISGEVLPRDQNHNEATYDPQISRRDGLLDFRKPALQLEREIRAYSDWPKSHTVIAGKDVVITKVHVETLNEYSASDEIGKVSQHAKQLCIQTSQGALVIDMLKPAGKTEMSGGAFLSGYGKNI